MNEYDRIWHPADEIVAIRQPGIDALVKALAAKYRRPKEKAANGEGMSKT